MRRSLGFSSHPPMIRRLGLYCFRFTEETEASARSRRPELVQLVSRNQVLGRSPCCPRALSLCCPASPRVGFLKESPATACGEGDPATARQPLGQTAVPSGEKTPVGHPQGTETLHHGDLSPRHASIPGPGTHPASLGCRACDSHMVS